MAVKYVRESYRNRPGGGRGLFATNGPPGANIKQRLIIIYLGIAMFAVLLLSFQFTGLGRSLRWLPVEEGTAVVAEKIAIEGEAAPVRYYLDLEVTVPRSVLPVTDAGPAASGGSRTFVDRVSITDSSWEMVEKGTRVNVTYQVAADGSNLVIRGIQLQVPASEPSPSL